MKGNPKTLNSKADFIYVKENCEVGYWLPRWKGLLEGRFIWISTGELENEDAGVTDDTHRVDVSTQTDDLGEETTVYTQLELVEDPYSTFARLGFTEDEVNAAIAEGEALIAG